MRAYGKKILLEMIMEDRVGCIIETLDGSERPQTLMGKVIAIGEEVVGINVGDLVIAQVGVGDCYKDKHGKKYKSMDYHLSSIVFSESDREDAAQFKRI